ncbi:hypothetical protein ACSSS7_007799 [Eimeria intestinalis]
MAEGAPLGGPSGAPPASGRSRAAEEASNAMADDVVAVEERRGPLVGSRGPYFDYSGESRAPERRPQSLGDDAISSPTRSQQPVRLTPEGALAFEMLEEGQGPKLESVGEDGSPSSRRGGGGGLQSLRRRSSSRLKAMGDSTPTLVPFGYGACEANLGLLDEGGVPGGHSSLLQLPSLQGQQQRRQQRTQKIRCGFGVCAGDRGWPAGRVNGGERAASKASGDSPNPRILGVMGALDSNMIRNYGEVYRVFWAANLHGGWVHLIVNLLCQTAVLFILEPVWGFWRCLFTWFVGAMSGNLLSAVFDPCTVTVGSSGALYGLLGGLVPFCLENWDYMNYPWCIFLLVVVIIAVAQLTNMGGFSNVDNFAHLGGCLGGLLFGFATIYSLRAEDLLVCMVGKAAAMLLLLVFVGQKENSSSRFHQKTRVWGSGSMVRDKNMREEMKKQPVDGPPFVWRCWEGCLEWFVRLVALSFLLCALLQVVSLVYLWLYLLNPLYYETLKTPGRISFLGSIGCNCCRLPSRLEIEGDSVLSLLPPHHTIRVNAGAFWCFESPYHADFFCGKMFRNGSISLKPADASRRLQLLL